MRETLGRYRILDKVGAGGIGELYRARDTRLGRTVALRVIAPGIAGDPDRLQALLRDARSRALVSHPNVAELYEVGEDAGFHYLACEFVVGQTLKSLIAGHPLNARRAVDLSVQLADALADAHAHDLVHGDVRPETIIVTAKGSAKLLDFGLAAWSGTRHTRVQPDDPQADISSLGAVLFEMLTGCAPARDGLYRGAGPSLPREVGPIVRRALNSDPAARYQSAATLAADLRDLSEILDRRTPGAPASARDARPAWRGRAAAWLLAMAALGAIAWLVWSAGRG